MALANGLSSHLLQSLSPGLLSSSLHHTNTGTVLYCTVLYCTVL